jgi:hypothetical protein
MTNDYSKKAFSVEKTNTVFPLPSVVLFAAFLLFANLSLAQSSASNDQNTIVYKFSVAGVTTPTEAAPVLGLLMEQSFSISGRFIDECDCFKLSTNTEVDYEDLSTPLSDESYLLSDTIENSYGKTITEKTTNNIKD